MKMYIRNRDNNEISILVEGLGASSELVFIAHGLSGNKDELHIRKMIEAFLELECMVVSYDAVHTFGKSRGGKFEDATITNYLHDLEDVIQWSGTQEWYVEPFILCGHSLGSVAIATYAQQHPEKVKALAPISTVVSGKLSLETPAYAQDSKRWEHDGIRITKKSDGSEMRLKWSHMEDRLKYDLLSEADKLTMPVLMVVGSEDSSTPPTHQQLLFDKLAGPKEMHLIDGAVHTFNKPEEREELKSLTKVWANKHISKKTK